MAEQKSLAIAETEDSRAIMPQSDSAAILSMIERAASNPAVDVDKMERLMSMRERMRAADAKEQFYSAFADMQTELPLVAERGEIKIGSGPGQKYALWEDINEAIKPVLSKHGFALRFRTGHEETKITVTGVLSHRAGYAEETTISLPSDTSGSKNAVQAVGSSTSYGKRYAAAALLNLTSGATEDDDGRGAGGNGPISDEQRATILELAERVGANLERFCAYMKAKSVPEIRAKDYDQAIIALNTKAKKL